ncbi:MAG: hypothetical protein R2852_08415 [Bacteroidia bacterium]
MNTHKSFATTQNTVAPNKHKILQAYSIQFKYVSETCADSILERYMAQYPSKKSTISKASLKLNQCPSNLKINFKVQNSKTSWLNSDFHKSASFTKTSEFGLHFAN